MATRDILVLNTTASRAETQQGSDTVVIRGNSGEALSVENSSGTSILSVNTVSSSVDFAGNITASGDISSSITSTGSFGRVEATTLVGDAFNLTNTAIPGTISSSGQIASQISGAFRQGFEFDGTIGSVAGHTTTASFDRIVATVFSGSAANLTNTALIGTLSSSAQIASQISGSFNKGFEFTGTISGSATSTGSFGQLFAKKAVGNVSAMTNLIPKGTVSGSKQIASQISGSFNKGFEFTGTISGSATSTGSFSNIKANKVFGDVSNLTGLIPSGIVSSSAQIASRVSGSFNKGFEFSGTIKRGNGTWSLGAALPAAKGAGVGAGQQNAALEAFGSPGGWPAASINAGVNMTETYEYNGSSWSDASADVNVGRVYLSGGGTQNAAIGMGGNTPVYGSGNEVTCTEEYDGSSWSNATAAPRARYTHGSLGTQNSFMVVGHQNAPLSSTSDEYDGTNWTAGGDTPHADRNWGGAGTVNAGSVTGGRVGPAPYHLLYDGTTWSEGGPGIADNHYDPGHSGTQNDSVRYGGYINGSPYAGQTCTYLWDGSTWSADTSLVVGSADFQGSTGQAPNGSADTIAIGGASASPSYGTCTQHWTMEFTTGSFGRVEVTSISGDGSNLTGTALAGTISSSGQIASQISGAFTSGFTVSGDITNIEPTFTYAAGEANLSNARWRGASGIKTAGLAFGGQTPTRVGDTETFDGTTWTEVNNLITSGPTVGGGTTNATVAFGGWYRGACTETWDGTSWTEVNDLITSRGNIPAPIKLSHSQNAALAAGSSPAPIPNTCTEEWNGTNWSTSNDLIKAMVCADGFGTPAGGVAIGTDWPLTPFTTNNAVLWNGLNWSEGPLLPPSGQFVRMTNAGTAGAENDGIVAGQCQYQGAIQAGTACYNGITFNLGDDLPTGCAFHRGAGTNVANAWFVGGQSPSAPYYPSSGFTVSSGVASASFSHIEGIRISGSVDQMTNIDEPSGTISGSGQIASYVSGSFNKGFEFSGEIKSLGVFSAGGDFPGHYNHFQHSSVYGTQNAALLGGGMGYYQASKCDTYTYNGSSWSDTGADMIIARGGYSGIGTQDAALAAGGNPYKSHIFQYLMSVTEEWNGSAWSETTNLPHQLTFLNHQSAGTQNAGLIAGGYTGTGAANMGSGSEAFQRTNLTWDGLSYTLGASMANERGSGGVVGSMNSALAQGSNNGLGHSTCTEEWNGSAWSDAAASNFPTSFVSNVGTSNNAMHVLDANSPLKVGCTDFYNGVSWSTGPLAGLSSPSAYKQCTAAGGSTSAGLFMTFNNSCVEHFNEYAVTSSIGRVDADELSLESNTDLTVNESLQIPQYATNPPITSSAGEVWYNTAEEKLYFTYDINSWSEVADLNTAKGLSFGAAGSGIHDALAFGGATAGLSPVVCTRTTELWNGTSWSEVADLQDDMLRTGGTGCSSNAAIMTGAASSNPIALFQSKNANTWDGSTWTEVSDHITSRGCTSMSGTANAALLAPGVVYGGSGSPTTEEWNGTNWTTSTNASLSYGQYNAQLIGTQNDTIQGADPGAYGHASHYDGTSWATINNYSDYCSRAGFGTANAAIYAGGCSPSPSGAEITISEEYNGLAWSQASQLGQGRAYGFRAGTQGSGMLSGGSKGHPGITVYANTEQYTTTGIGCHCIGGV